MKKRIAFLASVVLKLHAASGSQIMLQLHPASSSDYPVLAVPGQNGLGSSREYVASQLGIDQEKIYRVSTPSACIDFGQRFCQKGLSLGFEAIDTRNGYIIHATSQGTATVLNYLAANPIAQHSLRGVVLEAVMASGNSAIAHNVHESPIGHVLAPYVARLIQFWTYSPSGMQAIKSIEKLLNKDCPIVLVHSTRDGCLPYYGACAIYYGLKEKGHRNVYFVTKEDSRRHIEILDKSLAERSIVKSILAQHGVVEAGHADAIRALTEYQPDHMQYQAIYEKLCLIEKAHTAIGATLTTACAAYMLYYIMMFSGIA